MARLIEADALKAKAHADPDSGEGFVWVQDIDEAPTVDAVPVVHGRWIDEYPFVRCSVCNAEWLNCRTDNEPKLFYYCPNCGATMDLEVKDA